MLLSLRVFNFVLIDEIQVDFHRGLNVLTGETGAGKSVLIGALNLLLGDRASSDIHRQPDHEAVIEAAFELENESAAAHLLRSLLEEAGIPWEENLLLISRRITPQGRSRIFVNNTQCLVKVLRKIGDALVDLHGQHEHQSLLHKSQYRPLLDDCGNYTETLEEYSSLFHQWTETRKQLEDWEQNERERRRQLESMQFQLREIDQAELSPDEENQLETRLRLLQHAGRLMEGCTTIIHNLDDSHSQETPLLDQLDQLESTLEDLTQVDNSLSSLLSSWQEAVISLREIVRELQSYTTQLEFDPQERETLQQRRFQIRDLKSKYGATLEEVLEYAEGLRKELSHFENADEEREALRQQEQNLRQRLIPCLKKLHNHREKTAKYLSTQITNELKDLGMKDARFEIAVDYHYDENGLDIHEKSPVHPGPHGADQVEFLVRTIPDKPTRPLREVASGGEISRIMLALKCTLGMADPVPMMVFDEIDVGVGGETAEAVADRLVALAQRKQVLCITHLPQIASKADQNLRVEKQKKGDSWVSQVRLLKGSERERELARMLGREDSTASQRYARELLKRT